MKSALTVAIRLGLGAALAWPVALAAAAPELPRGCAVATSAILVLTLWRPGAGLLLVAALAPTGALLAPAPARIAELFAWTFIAAWLLRLWHPLSSSWPRVITIPAALYGAAALASWLSLTIGGAGGVPPGALPLLAWHSIPPDHLIFSSPEPETWTLLQSLTGVSLLLAAVGITRTDAGIARAVAWTIVVSMALLALATLLDVARQWSEVEFGAWYLGRYVQGERFSLHLTDLNAAGSLYVLAGLTAAGLTLFDPDRRVRWITLLLVMLPAVWLTGSRSSTVAFLGGLLLLGAAQIDWRPTRAQIAAAASVLVAVLLAGVLMADWRTDVQGSAGQAVNLRSQFSATTARMFASAPVYGVGIGRYFDRSSEFMSDRLRAIYGNENAHNYFAQQFAELGVVGGSLFLWLVGACVWRGWIGDRTGTAKDRGVLMGLFAGTFGYLLTCFTGHPLLVSEAAIPFWAAFGVAAGRGGADADASALRRPVAVAAIVLLLAGVGQGVAAYARTAAPPPERGFHQPDTATDGTRYRWMVRHGVTYIQDGIGFLRLRLRAPDRPAVRTLIVETAVAGRVVDRREVTSGRWVAYDVAIREAASTPFRRVDLRVNQFWTEEVPLGRRTAERPIAVMVGGEGRIEWIPLR
ncbi:MAG: O-antigen ligase family protein [Acidobacteria bacterium]|nr:O-antigen ligase family protein [Acidobacteriota bacterium]